MKVQALLVTALAGTAGCSLLDALGGGTSQGDGGVCSDPFQPGCTERQLRCPEPLFVGVVGEPITLDGCKQDASEPPDACQPGFGEDAVFQLQVPPGLYTVCVNGPPTSSFSLVSDCFSPGSDALCLGVNTCTDEVLDGDRFLIWHASDLGDCGPIEFILIPVTPGIETGPACLDGFDNDANGKTDCEDPSCQQPSPECQFASGPELCDGGNDFDTPGLPANLSDEVACRCLVDEGCDKIGGDVGYVCHEKFSPDGALGGTCAPLCDNAQNTWCIDLGGICDADGRCTSQVSS